MQTSTIDAEAQALIANDIRVLAGQINDAVKRGAERGLKIQIEVSSVLDVKGSASLYPALSVRIAAEIQ